jgi:hypothetical protein
LIAQAGAFGRIGRDGQEKFQSTFDQGYCAYFGIS